MCSILQYEKLPEEDFAGKSEVGNRMSEVRSFRDLKSLQLLSSSDF